MRPSAPSILHTLGMIIALWLVAGCSSDRFTPQLRSDSAATERGNGGGATSGPTARRVSILVMLPTYGFTEQIRRGNMGHAAIDVDGRLYDIGSLNGYAYAFRASTGIRFWDFESADAALASIAKHPDVDGHLDRIVRYDVLVTSEQAKLLHRWWQQLEAKMNADERNRMYLWSDLQCASAVSRSLRDAGVMNSAVQTPRELADHLAKNLRHTAGEHAGKPAPATLVQAGRAPATQPRGLGQAATLLVGFPRLFSAGERSDLTVEGPDGTARRVLWSDSDAYYRWVSEFKISPREAVRIAKSAGVGHGAQPLPNFVIGRWYHVATDHTIGQAALGGTYVNGDSALVIQCTSLRIIRFDAFRGDRVVFPGAEW